MSAKFKNIGASVWFMILARWIKQEDLAPITYIIDFKERPVCPSCNTPMNINSYSTPSKRIGLYSVYCTIYKYYMCEHPGCPNLRKKKVRAVNTRCAPYHQFDYEVAAKICELHFKGLKNLGEIETHLKITYNIKISKSTIGTIVRRYEVASKYENESIAIEEMKKNGGALICIDAIHPYNGAKLLLAARDFYTGRIIYVKKVKTQKVEVQEAFQKTLKQIMEENEITVLGIMSDDHKSQRIAIKNVWGDLVPHCSCLFHFYKQIMHKPLELHSKLIKTLRKALRRITWVEYFRKGELNLDEARPISRYIKRFIKDLFAFTSWKIGRNNLNLDAKIYFERIFDFHGELSKLKKEIDANQIALNKQERTILLKLLLRLKMMLDENKQNYLELCSILTQILVIKEVLDTHDEKDELGLETLNELVDVLRERLKTTKKIGKHETHFIKEFVDFISNRGQTLFNYRKVNENYIKCNNKIQEKLKKAKNQEEKDEIRDKLYVPRTNNALESMFKAIRYNLKRTLGQHTANRYLLAHGEYILHVDFDASFERIKEILMNADYKAISKELKKKRKPRLTRIQRLQDDEEFELIMKEYKKMRADILAEYK